MLLFSYLRLIYICKQRYGKYVSFALLYFLQESALGEFSIP
ncbi:hypothetical protein HMPREF0673_01976 [Leyella stercorea DSM 18206]|uniref:Uncharacterized protein n=1 Tax=Leyella stercorea DSM 18206 TaxID=1002367 RepID=G6AZB2_9BACT|nr:hypothetical protein HMPREF0673_01976 [Leyella stercorea DSM 18206]